MKLKKEAWHEIKKRELYKYNPIKKQILIPSIINPFIKKMYICIYFTLEKIFKIFSQLNLKHY